MLGDLGSDRAFILYAGPVCLPDGFSEGKWDAILHLPDSKGHQTGMPTVTSAVRVDDRATGMVDTL